MVSDGAAPFGHVNVMPYGVNRIVIFQAFRLNQCHHHDFDSHHVSGIHHNFIFLRIDTDSIFDDNNNIHHLRWIKVS